MNISLGYCNHRNLNALNGKTRRKNKIDLIPKSAFPIKRHQPASSSSSSHIAKHHAEKGEKKKSSLWLIECVITNEGAQTIGIFKELFFPPRLSSIIVSWLENFFVLCQTFGKEKRRNKINNNSEAFACFIRKGWWVITSKFTQT